MPPRTAPFGYVRWDVKTFAHKRVKLLATGTLALVGRSPKAPGGRGGSPVSFLHVGILRRLGEVRLGAATGLAATSLAKKTYIVFINNICVVVSH